MNKKDKIKALKNKKEKLLNKYGDFYLDYLSGKEDHYETSYQNTVTSISDILKKLESHIDLIDEEIDRLDGKKIEK